MTEALTDLTTDLVSEGKQQQYIIYSRNTCSRVCVGALYVDTQTKLHLAAAVSSPREPHRDAKAKNNSVAKGDDLYQFMYALSVDQYTDYNFNIIFVILFDDIIILFYAFSV